MYIRLERIRALDYRSSTLLACVCTIRYPLSVNIYVAGRSNLARDQLRGAHRRVALKLL